MVLQHFTINQINLLLKVLPLGRITQSDVRKTLATSILGYTKFYNI